MSGRLPIAALCAVTALLWAGPAAAAPIDEGGVTPVAKPGSRLAERSGISRGSLRDELARAVAGDGSSAGVWVYDVEAGEQLFADSASKLRIPASNQKLFTTAAFLTEFGADGRLETRAYAKGKLRGRRRGTLAGDLVLVGDGDPAFGTGRFARANDQPATKVSRLAREIARTGVKRITGRVLADDTVFDRERRAGPYLSPLSGLSFNNGYAGNGYARDPELEAAKGLKQALRKRAVRVKGQVGHANLSLRTLRRKPLASIGSPTAAKLIEETNVPSNNFFAEMLLKRLGASSGKRGTRKRGANKVEAFAKSLGVEVRAADGSGLSRRNKASAANVGKLLQRMAEPGSGAAAFRQSLPVAGREGTLANRMRGTAAEGNCAAKTGTLSGVSALSGYCGAGRHTIAFSALMNSADVDAARRAQDRIAAAIARYHP